MKYIYIYIRVWTSCRSLVAREIDRANALPQSFDRKYGHWRLFAVRRVRNE